MNFNTEDGLRNGGFRGFVPVRDLQTSQNHIIPDKRGVYLVVRLKAPRVRFRTKTENIGVGAVALRDRWVKDAVIIYIYVGKAGGPGKKATLRTRLHQYLRSSQGKNAGHRGGRLIWLVQGSGDLRICWKTTGNSDPRALELSLIREFEKRHDKPPFANLSH